MRHFGRLPSTAPQRQWESQTNWQRELAQSTSRGVVFGRVHLISNSQPSRISLHLLFLWLAHIQKQVSFLYRLRSHY
eukprot:g9306.t1